MHAGPMATKEPTYLTIRGVGGALVALVFQRLTCARRGHDPVLANGEVLCGRCFATLPL